MSIITEALHSLDKRSIRENNSTKYIGDGILLDSVRDYVADDELQDIEDYIDSYGSIYRSAQFPKTHYMIKFSDGFTTVVPKEYIELDEALHTLEKSNHKRVQEAKHKEHPDLTKIKGTYSQVVSERMGEIKGITDANSAIEFVRSIEPIVKDKSYVQRVLRYLAYNPWKGKDDIQSYLINSIMSGGNNGVISVGKSRYQESAKKGTKESTNSADQPTILLDEDYDAIIDEIEKELKADLKMNEELRREDDEVQGDVRKYLTDKVNEFLFDDGFDYAQVVENAVPGYDAEWCKDEDDPDEDIAVTAAIDTIVEMLMQNLFYKR